MTATINAAAGSVRLDSYKGNTTIVFGANPNHAYNLSFGKSKAGLLIDAIETHGVEHVLTMLRQVAERPAAVAAVPATAQVPPAVQAPAAKPATERPEHRVKSKTPPVVQAPAAPVVSAHSVQAPADGPISPALRAESDRIKLKGRHLFKSAPALLDAVNAKRATMGDGPFVETVAKPAESVKPAADATPAESKPTVVHRAEVKGLAYALLSNGETKRIVVRNGKETFRKCDVKLALPSKPVGKAVLRTFRDGASEFVLYTDGTWACVERVERSV